MQISAEEGEMLSGQLGLSITLLQRLQYFYTIYTTTEEQLLKNQMHYILWPHARSLFPQVTARSD